jgi:hypothetical protein
MADHGLRLSRLSAPNPVSTITAAPSNTQGPCPPPGGDVGGPVEATAVRADGETDDPSAWIASEGEALAVVSAGVAVATLPAGGVMGRDGGAAVAGCTAGHTWLKDAMGGGVCVFAV